MKRYKALLRLTRGSSLLLILVSILLPLSVLAQKLTPEPVEGSPEWIEKALEKHDFVSVRNFGVKCVTGNGCPKNVPLARDLFVRLSLLGDTTAERTVSMLYDGGIGVARNTTKTMDWLEMSARDGNLQAQTQLGEAYLVGWNVSSNAARAFSWISLAAKKGFSQAQFDLGIIYHNGAGVKQDDIEAVSWLQIACSNGFGEACQALEQVSLALTPIQKQSAKRQAESFKPDSNAPMVPDYTEKTICTLDSHFRIPVKVLGETRSILVDTGMSMTALDLDYRPRLGQPLTSQAGMSSSGNRFNSDFFECPDFFIGQTRMAPLLVGLTDLKAVAASTSLRLDGILGMNCLEYHVVCLDPDKGEFSVGGEVPEVIKKTAMQVPLLEDSVYTYAINAFINGRGPILLEIDSGFDQSISLNDADWQKVLAGTTTRTNYFKFTDVTGKIQSTPCVRLQSIVIGTNNYTNWIAGHQSTSPLNSRIGSKFLRRHLCVLDFPNEMLYLVPGKGFNRSDEWDMSGIFISDAHKKLEVETVSAFSPAFMAGIDSGDQIVSINELKGDSLKMDSIEDLFTSKPGTEITMQVLRKEKTNTFKFTLQRRL